MPASATRPMRTFCSLFFAVLCVRGSVALAQNPPPPPAETADPALSSYLAANGLLNRGLYDLAATEYRQFLSANPQHEKAPVARYGLGVALFRLSKIDEAVEQFAALRDARDFAFAAEARLLHGQCLLALKKDAEAAAAFDDVLARFGDHDVADDAAAGLVEARYRTAKHADGLAAAKVFTQRWPQSPLLERVEFFAGLSEMSSEQPGPAAARFARIAERQADGPLAAQAEFLAAQCAQRAGELEAAERGYRASLKRADSRYLPDTLYGLAAVLIARKQSAEATPLLDRLLADFGDHALAAAARYQRAGVHFAAEEFDPALELFERAERDGGDLADDAAYWAAKCRLRNGAAADAARRLAAAIEKWPDSNVAAEMHYDRGVALARAEQPAEAAAALEAFLSQHSKHVLAPDALHLLAACEHQQKKFDRSAAHCEAFLKAHADHALAADVLRLLADNQYLAGEYAEAAASYARVLERPSKPEVERLVRLRRGLALFEIERFDEAAGLLRELAGAAAAGEAGLRPALLALGEISFRRSEWKPAEEFLAQYVAGAADGPGLEDAWLKLSLARARQQKHDLALTAFDEFLRRFGDSEQGVAARFERGQCLLALGRDADAAAAFEQVVEAGRATRFAPYALNHLGVLAERAGDHARAAQRFSAVLKCDPAPEPALRADAAFNRAAALLAGGDDKAGSDALKAFIEEHGDDARVSQARAQLTVALHRLGTCADALAASATLRDADLAGLDAALRDALRYSRAICLRETDRGDEATATLRELASAAGPLRAHAALDAAAAEMTVKRYEAAAALLRDARGNGAALPPEVAEPLTYRLAVCEVELKHWDDAAKLFEELLTAFPDTRLAASATFFAGEAHLQAGRPQRAVEHLTRAADLYDSAPEAGAALLRLGEALTSLQQWSRAEQVFGDYLSRFGREPAAVQARFGVGWARENLGRHDEAIEAYREVVAVDKSALAARAQFQTGECLYAKKDYESAVRELLKVDILFAYPEWSAAALYEAGRCFEALNKHAEARQHFDQVVKKYGDTRWAQLASERLAARPADVPPGR